jgi:hypothetical protein
VPDYRFRDPGAADFAAQEPDGDDPLMALLRRVRSANRGRASEVRKPMIESAVMARAAGSRMYESADAQNDSLRKQEARMLQVGVDISAVQDDLAKPNLRQPRKGELEQRHAVLLKEQDDLAEAIARLAVSETVTERRSAGFGRRLIWPRRSRSSSHRRSVVGGRPVSTASSVGVNSPAASMKYSSPSENAWIPRASNSCRTRRSLLRQVAMRRVFAGRRLTERVSRSVSHLTTRNCSKACGARASRPVSFAAVRTGSDLQVHLYVTRPSSPLHPRKCPQPWASSKPSCIRKTTCRCWSR